MSAKIIVKVEAEPGAPQMQVAELEFKPASQGPLSSFVVGPVDVGLPDGTIIQVSSSWVPKTNMISLMILQGDQIIGHAGSCWHLGDPYLGVYVHKVGFVHIYSQRKSAR